MIHYAKKWFSVAELLAITLSGGLLLFILAPVIGIFVHTTPQSFISTVQDKEVTDSIALTLWTSALATFTCALLALPFAYILARKNFPLKTLVNSLIDIPVVIPHSAAGIAILGFVSRTGTLGTLGEAFGMRFVGTSLGISVAMAFVSVPYLINAARDGFSAVPVRLEHIAASLGASKTRIFFTISLPLATRAIISGLVLMWARGMSEFGAVVMVAYHPMITPVMIFERFGAYGLAYARPVSALFIAVCLILFFVFRQITPDKNGQN